MGSKAKKTLLNIGQVILFIVCLRSASYLGFWYVCKIRLHLEKVEFINSPMIGLLIFPLAVAIYCVAIAIIKLVIKADKSIRK